MKRNLFTIMLAFLVVFGVNAQEFGAVNNNGKAKEVAFAKKATMQNGLKSSKVSYLSEAFDTEIPATWTVDTDAGSAATWAWDDAGYANIDSDAAGSGSILVAGTLTSPTVDVSASTNLYLAFDHYYRHLGSQEGTVEVYDGAAWVNVVTFSASSGDMDHMEYDISSYINAAFAVRFYYTDASGWNWYWHLDNVVVFEPEPHDLGVDVVTPTFVLEGSTVTPQVTIHNYGSSDEATYSVELTDGAAYTSTIAVTTAIVSGTDAVIDMDAWTPANGAYTLTATVTVANDTEASNDAMTINCTVAGLLDAYAGNTTDGTYGTLDLADGTFAVNGTILTADFPMSQEFDGTTMYRVTAGADFGTVGADGAYTSLGALTGYSGTPVGLAWDWTNSIMYAMLLDAGNLPHLCTLDVATLTLTEIGVGTGMIIAIDMANDGFIYGPALDDESLYRIDPATGATTLVGSTGLDLNYGQDVSYDAETNSLYTLSCGGDYKFGTYDLCTGAFTEIADMAGAQYGVFAITKDGTPPATYTTTFTVDNGTDPIDGAVVTIDGVCGEFITDATGVTTMDVSNGDYDYTVTSGTCTPATGTFTVADAAVSVDVSLVCPVLYTVTFNVTDVTGPLDGASIAVNGLTLTTDATGVATFDAENGSYSYVVTMSGYDDFTSTTDAVVADADLTVDVVLTVEAGINTLNSNISVYPNPSNGVFNVTVNENVSLEVLDIAGKVLSTQAVNSNTTINISNAGVYFLRFSNENGTAVKRVIVK